MAEWPSQKDQDAVVPGEAQPEQMCGLTHVPLEKCYSTHSKVLEDQ